jgi:hypothetical protein
LAIGRWPKKTAMDVAFLPNKDIAFALILAIRANPWLLSWPTTNGQ